MGSLSRCRSLRHSSRPSRKRFLPALMALQVSLPPFLPLASLEAQAFTQTLVAAEARAEVKGEPSIPAEVQGWADAASAAYEKGSPAEALRLQQRVVAWVRAEGGAETLFQAYALANQGLYLGAVGRKKEAETAYGEALRRYQALARTMPSDSPDRPAVFQNLSRMLSELGRPQEALEPQREAVRLSRERAAANPASRKELAARLYRLGELFRSLDRHQEAQIGRAHV